MKDYKAIYAGYGNVYFMPYITAQNCAPEDLDHSTDTLGIGVRNPHAAYSRLISRSDSQGRRGCYVYSFDVNSSYYQKKIEFDYHGLNIMEWGEKHFNPDYINEDDEKTAYLIALMYDRK